MQIFCVILPRIWQFSLQTMKSIILLIAFILLGLVTLLLNKYARPKTQESPKANSQKKASEAEVSDTSDTFSLSVNNTSTSSVTENVTEDEAYERPDGCCGAHEVCENESLLAANTKIIYFADEELDDFKDRDPETYTDQEIEQFEEVFFTLRENELVEWLKSLQLRHIPLPPSIKEQALMIISERRKEPAVD